MESLVKPLLVGEDNPYGSDPRYALYPEPPNSAGGRLCRLVLGLTVRQYIGHFNRVNLCAGKWSMAEARRNAGLIRRRAVDTPVILLGAKVCAAFDLPFAPFSHSGSIAILPHPSGRCRAWSEPGAFGRARGLLLAMGVALPTNVREKSVECAVALTAFNANNNLGKGIKRDTDVEDEGEEEDSELVDPTCRNCGGPVSGPKRHPEVVSALDGACPQCGPER
jgi:hypothetical protein